MFDNSELYRKGIDTQQRELRQFAFEGTDMKKAGITLDDWKLPIFKRHLEQAGYVFENRGLFAPGTLLLRIDTTNLEALGEVLKNANAEAERTGKQL